MNSCSSSSEAPLAMVRLMRSTCSRVSAWGADGAARAALPLVVASSDIILLHVRPSSAPDDSVGLGLPDAEPLSNVALPHALLGESADGPDIALAEASVRVLLTASLGPQTPTLGVRDVLLRREIGRAHV